MLARRPPLWRARPAPAPRRACGRVRRVTSARAGPDHWSPHGGADHRVRARRSRRCSSATVAKWRRACSRWRAPPGATSRRCRLHLLTGFRSRLRDSAPPRHCGASASTCVTAASLRHAGPAVAVVDAHERLAALDPRRRLDAQRQHVAPDLRGERGNTAQRLHGTRRNRPAPPPARRRRWSARRGVRRFSGGGAGSEHAWRAAGRVGFIGGRVLIRYGYIPGRNAPQAGRRGFRLRSGRAQTPDPIEACAAG